MSEVPLTKLFKKLDNPFASVEDALKACNGDFTAGKESVYIVKFDDNGTPVDWKKVPHFASIVRQEEWEPMSIMKDRYGIIQYHDALDFLSDMIGNREAEIYGASTLDGGAKLHLIVKVPEFIELSPGEKYEYYFIVSASHDGSGRLQAMCSPIHNISQTVFTPVGRGVVSVKHTAKAEARLAQAKRLFAKLHHHFSDFGTTIREMVSIQLTDQQARDYFLSVLPKNDDGKRESRRENVRNHMFDIYKSVGLCCHLSSCSGTLFGCFMAVQQQADYYKTVRKSIRRNEVDAKIEARLTGDGAKMKAEAYSAALLLMKSFGH